MRVFIVGIDGYLGWTFAQYLAARGVVVGGCDALLRRDWVHEMDSSSAIPIASVADREEAFGQAHAQAIEILRGDITEQQFITESLQAFAPDAVVHLAEMPSAPYSMIDRDHCVFTHVNNLVGTLNVLFAVREVCPDAHLLKLGTMGEYGTPNLDIPEGFFEVEYRGRKDRLPFPRQAGSWYHQTKVHDSNNIMFACKIWGLRSTDIMQGVVFGTRIDEMGSDSRLLTRFDFDQAFGTAINRYCAQAVASHPLTVFGAGSQRRGFLALRDSMQCLTLALENPPEKGEYRVFNQFEEVYSVAELALAVADAARAHQLDVTIQQIENPRAEMESHHYNPDHQLLRELGYRPTHTMAEELDIALGDLIPHRERIEKHRAVLMPDIRWDGPRRPSEFLDNAPAD